MSAEDDLQRLEVDKERLARYLEWRIQRRRQRRRMMVGIALGAGLSGAAAVMLVVSLPMVRGPRVAHRAASPTLPSAEVAPASPVGRGAEPSAEPQPKARPEATDRVTHQAAVKPSHHPSLAGQATGRSTINVFERKNATAPTVPPGPATPEATPHDEPARPAVPSVTAEAPRSVASVAPAPPVSTVEPAAVSGAFAPSVVPSEPTPTLQKIKTALQYVPEVWLATHVVQWVKSQPPANIDRERTVDGSKSRLADAP